MLYKLISTYEVFLNIDSQERPVRVEIFKTSNDNNFRVRAWILNTYNLYPTFMNTDDKGDDLHKVHSSDDINQDITSLVFDDPGVIKGRRFKSESKVLEYVEGKIKDFSNIFHEG